jgi:hypothetical protein
LRIEGLRGRFRISFQHSLFRIHHFFLFLYPAGMNEVLETSEWVARESGHVHIDHEALVRIPERAIRDQIRIPPWEERHHFYDGGIRTVWYFLILDSLNFCFWPLPGRPRWEVMIDGESLSGYYAMAASLKRAFLSGNPLDEAESLSSLTRAELVKILYGQGELQLLETRIEILREVGRVLLEDYRGDAGRLVEEAGGSALKLARLLGLKFRSFRDEAVYQGQEVFFYKRAQILAADLFGSFQGKGWGAFSDMDRLTAFADYKLPQVLRHLGVLHYDDPLARKVDSCVLIEAGSDEEVEIRANTVWAVELLRREFQRQGVSWRSYEIDWMLWNMGQEDAFRQKPYHRTVTIFY